MKVIFSTPGSGKSTFARYFNACPLCNDAVVIDTDMWRDNILAASAPEDFEQQPGLLLDLAEHVQIVTKRETILVTNIPSVVIEARARNIPYAAFIVQRPWNRPNESADTMLEYGRRLTEEHDIQVKVLDNCWQACSFFWKFALAIEDEKEAAEAAPDRQEDVKNGEEGEPVGETPDSRNVGDNV